MKKNIQSMLFNCNSIVCKVFILQYICLEIQKRKIINYRLCLHLRCIILHAKTKLSLYMYMFIKSTKVLFWMPSFYDTYHQNKRLMKKKMYANKNMSNQFALCSMMMFSPRKTPWSVREYK